MNSIKKSVSVLLALLMLVSVMPMSVFAATGQTFDLVIDNDANDTDVTYPDDMGEAPTGTGLYDGVTPTGIKLDWDAWQTIFPDDDMTSNQDISFTLWRKTATEAVESTEEVDEVNYGSPEKVSIISDNSVVKVLNVYPIPASEGLLKAWLELAYEGSGEKYTNYFSVDTVLLDATAATHAGVAVPAKTFNADYATILAEGDYDVIFFGTSDGNGDLASVSEAGYTRTFYDLSSGACAAVKQFLADGKGVLFGHDTVCSADHLDGDITDGTGFDYFTQFAGDLGIECVKEADAEKQGRTQNEITDKIEVENTGLLTSYPFTISENLTVPETHSLLQKVPSNSSATVWMRLLDSGDSDSVYDLGAGWDAYLLTNGNVAMIQTGHSSNNLEIDKSANKQEGQIIANTLFYLKQKSLGDYSTDGGFIDNEAPVIEDNGTAQITELTSDQKFYADVEVNASDLGSAYQYYVEASKDESVVATSNEVQALAISNLKGYMVQITESETKIGAKAMADARKDAQDATNRTIVVDVESEGVPLSETITFNTADVPGGESGLKVVAGKSYYAHIVPVDNANNYGNEIVVEINFEELYDPTVNTELETVLPDDDTVPADARTETETTTDGSGNTTTETTTYYYPGNYLDKDGNEFDERQTDTEIKLSATTSVNTLDREVIGTLVIVDKDGNEVKRIEKIEANPSYEYPIETELNVTISEIYDEDDYDEDGEFTATITWNDKETGEQVAEDECKIIIKRPDYKVTFEYDTNDDEGNVVPDSDVQYVKHGEDATAPDDVPQTVEDYPSFRNFKEWDKEFTNITENTVIKAEYNDDYLPDAEGDLTPDTTYDENGDLIDADGDGVADSEVDGSHYHTRTWDGEKFISDENVVLDYTVALDPDYAAEHNIIGELVITKTGEDGNVYEETITVPVTPNEAASGQIVIPLEDIYDEDDYNEDGVYTATITWYAEDENGDKTDESIGSATGNFTILQPEYKVTYNYKVETKDGEVEDVQSTEIVKHGDAANAPETKGSVSDGKYIYISKNWQLDEGGESLNSIVADSVFILNYTRYSLGSAPTQPTDPPVEDNSKEVEFERLGGEDRIETAIKISQEGWEDGAKVVILATANEFPDAMAGVPLAKAVDAPILLTVNGEKLEDIVKSEIARLNPEKVYILGQTEAVNANIEAELKALYEVERLGGKDRFETAVHIAYEMEEVYGEKADAVYFVRSDLFPDALSVSSVAAIEHNPILYVAPNGNVDALTVSYCSTIGTEATIIGGPQAVVEAGENNVKKLFKSVSRIYGDDRYATSVEVCTAKEDLFTGEYTTLATGLKFPDALTGGSFAAKNNSPVLLVNGSVSPELAIYLSNRPITKLYVFGGPVAVSEFVAQEALHYCRYLYY